MLERVFSQISETRELQSVMILLQSVDAPLAILKVRGEVNGELWIANGRTICFAKVESGSQGAVKDLLRLLSLDEGDFSLEISTDEPPKGEVSIGLTAVIADQKAAEDTLYALVLPADDVVHIKDGSKWFDEDDEVPEDTLLDSVFGPAPDYTRGAEAENSSFVRTAVRTEEEDAEDEDEDDEEEQAGSLADLFAEESVADGELSPELLEADARAEAVAGAQVIAASPFAHELQALTSSDRGRGLSGRLLSKEPAKLPGSRIPMDGAALPAARPSPAPPSIPLVVACIAIIVLLPLGMLLLKNSSVTPAPSPPTQKSGSGSRLPEGAQPNGKPVAATAAVVIAGMTAQDIQDMKTADDLSAAGNQERAAEIYTAIVSRNPRLLSVRLKAAKALIACGRFRTAKGLCLAGMDSAQTPAEFKELSALLKQSEQEE